MAEPTYYELLGVKPEATSDEIKKAFMQLARQHHPDVGGDEDKFKEISNAYDVLSDKDKRTEYDDMLRYGAFFAGGRGSGGSPGHGQGPAWRSVVSDFGNIGDIFSRVSSGEGVFGTNWNFPNQPAKGRDVQATLEVSFEEAYHGADKRVTIKSGSTGEQVVDVKVPAGAVDGGKLRYKGQGSAGAAGGEPGDLVIVTKLKKHHLYQRKAADVLMTLPVSVAEAALGAQIVIPAPDGSMVKLRVPAGTAAGQVLMVRGKGAPRVNGSGFGDLRVEIELRLPDQLNDAQRAALQAFAEAGDQTAADIRPAIAQATAKATAKSTAGRAATGKSATTKADTAGTADTADTVEAPTGSASPGQAPPTPAPTAATPAQAPPSAATPAQAPPAEATRERRDNDE